MNRFKFFLIILLFTFVSVGSFGQDPPKPPDCPSPTNGGQVGNGPDGTPLSEGAWLMVGLAFAYGAYEFWKAKKRAKGSSEA